MLYCGCVPGLVVLEGNETKEVGNHFAGGDVSNVVTRSLSLSHRAHYADSMRY